MKYHGIFYNSTDWVYPRKSPHIKNYSSYILMMTCTQNKPKTGTISIQKKKRKKIFYGVLGMLSIFVAFVVLFTPDLLHFVKYCYCFFFCFVLFFYFPVCLCIFLFCSKSPAASHSLIKMLDGKGCSWVFTGNFSVDSFEILSMLRKFVLSTNVEISNNGKKKCKQTAINGLWKQLK